MKKGKIIGLLLVALLACGSSVNATIIVSDWTLNLDGIEGITDFQVDNIGQITFNGVVHNTNPDYPEPGYGWVDGLLQATALVNTGGATIPVATINPDLSVSIISGINSGINLLYQMTFDFSVTGYNTTIDPVTGAASFVHVAPADDPFSLTDGLLDIWIDGPAGGITWAENGTASGFTDGVKIATFRIMSGDGGIFTPATFDGSDDASFELVWALPGVLLDADGNDLSLLGDYLLGITDSNFDGNPGNQSPAGFNIGGPDAVAANYPNIETFWPFASNGYGSPGSFFAEEDGSARLGVVPEPSTFILLGAGLLGLGVIGRKRMRK